MAYYGGGAYNPYGPPVAQPPPAGPPSPLDAMVSSAGYRNAERVKWEITRTTSTYSDLSPGTDMYTYDNGRQSLLVNLTGTIPIVYAANQQRYNIPVRIWLLNDHPEIPPVPYVVPTAEMRVHPGKHVDAAGKVYLPYLHHWNVATSSIVGLIGVMAEVFGREAPVYSVAAQQQQQSSAAQPPVGSMSLPVQPSTSAQQATPSPAPQRPSRPPPPGSSSTGGAAQSAYDSEMQEHLRMSLEFEVARKVHDVVRPEHARAKATLQELMATKQQLEAGKEQLDDIFLRLEREEKLVDKNVAVLSDKIGEIQQSLAGLQGSGELDIDAAVITTAPLYKQLLTLIAEDNAIEDAIYHMDKALEQAELPLDVYMTTLRKLATKQFLTRALIEKARSRAGLES